MVKEHPGARRHAWTATACPSPPSCDHVDGQFELGASAYEKRGVAVSRARVGCRPSASSATSCAYVCPHATIRPFALTEEEAKQRSRRRPKIVRHQGRQGQGRLQFTMAVSPLDCMGCGVCVERLPGRTP